jgi:hypothetical protein
LEFCFSLCPKTGLCCLLSDRIKRGNRPRREYGPQKKRLGRVRRRNQRVGRRLDRSGDLHQVRRIGDNCAHRCLRGASHRRCVAGNFVLGEHPIHRSSCWSHEAPALPRLQLKRLGTSPRADSWVSLAGASVPFHSHIVVSSKSSMNIRHRRTKNTPHDRRVGAVLASKVLPAPHLCGGWPY